MKSALGSVQELVVFRGKQDWHLQDILNDEERGRKRERSEKVNKQTAGACTLTTGHVNKNRHLDDLAAPQ